MTKKMMLLALAALSAALFALPAVASAEEIHIEPGNQNFTISGGAGSLAASGEPTVTCGATDGSGSQTNATTGTMTLDFTECHIVLFGFTFPCKSEGSSVKNTIATSGTYHLITGGATGAKYPAILVTAATTIVNCEVAKVYVTGDVIGTITSPSCNGESTSLGLSFSATGFTQNQELYTGNNYDLKASTNSDHTNEVTAALTTNATATTANPSTLRCT